MTLEIIIINTIIIIAAIAIIKVLTNATRQAYYDYLTNHVSKQGIIIIGKDKDNNPQD